MAINVKVASAASIEVKRKSNPRVLINQSDLVINNLRDLSDVDVTNLEDGSFLVYNSTTQKFVTTTILEIDEIDGGEF